MRDPDRIPVVIEALRKCWHSHPDQRFGQLVMNLTSDRHGAFQDPWNWEDDEWLRRIERYTTST